MITSAPTLARSLAGALAVAAIMAPAAGARLSDEETGLAPAQPATSSSQVDTASVSPTVTSSTDDGFDWGSAAIGGGAIAAVLLAAGGAAAVTDHRRHAHPPVA